TTLSLNRGLRYSAKGRARWIRGSADPIGQRSQRDRRPRATRLLVDERRTCVADHLILRSGAPRTADGAEILPSSINGMPPRDAMTSSRLKMYLKSNFCTTSSKALVGRRYLAAARALCSAIAIEASCASSIRRKATRLAPESTTAMFIGQPLLL